MYCFTFQTTKDDTAYIVKFPIFNFRYYFPTYENDNLLCQLDDDDDDDDVSESRGGVAIIAEESNITNTILSDKTLRQELLS